MVHALAVRHRLLGLPAQCIPYEPARSPPCDTPPDHIAHPGRAVDRARAGRADHVIRCRERRGTVMFLRLQGRLRSVLQEEPGSLEVPGAAAALPRDLYQEQALTAPSLTRQRRTALISWCSASDTQSDPCDPAGP